MLTLEEVRQRLADIPAKEFGEAVNTGAIGQLHYILTGDQSLAYACNVYPEDVALIITRWNDDLDSEDRKALAMMMPLPESFPKLTPKRALRLNAWAGQKILEVYDGPKRDVMEQAVEFAGRAAAGETFTEDEIQVVANSVIQIQKNYETRMQLSTATAIRYMVYVLFNPRALNTAVSDAIGIALITGVYWPQWIEEYLKVRKRGGK